MGFKFLDATRSRHARWRQTLPRAYTAIFTTSASAEGSPTTSDGVDIKLIMASSAPEFTIRSHRMPELRTKFPSAAHAFERVFASSVASSKCMSGSTAAVSGPYKASE